MDLSRRRRTGCTECRRKKTKCDEKKPVCSRCSKFPRLCTYDLSIVRKLFTAPEPIILAEAPPMDVQSRTQRASPAAAASTSSLLTYRPAAFPMLRTGRHRFHFDHFIAHTVNIYFPLQPATTLGFVIPVAETHDYMLGALLAASYSHYYRLAGNETSRTSSIEATVETLAGLRSAMGKGGESVALLPTALLLATTCLCAGDTETYRKHLDGAILIVRQDGRRHGSNPLWAFSLRWLVHLLLMNRVSGQPLTLQQETYGLDWSLLLQSMPASSHVDESTGLSYHLVSILNEVCDLSDMDLPVPAQPSSPSAWLLTEPVASSPLVSMSATDAPSSLETRLAGVRSSALLAVQATTVQAQTELRSTHALFADAILLSLYRRVHALTKHHPKVQATVDRMICSLRAMDKRSQANIPLLWPLLAAGCEAATNEQRLFLADRMTAMGSHGLGNCLIVLRFMQRYWAEGGDSKWNEFAREIGVDLVLF
ncbi:hypothetical protein VDGE_09758 [Verticillium dahliae]|uniref:Zn(2)-C6 fungal-type domain-containing protein n=1 Tax=Verticillium dahliae TaxID=27337 RepID=A0A444RQ48_VERDA|nr:hypothetical protein VDGE_09758 [Verticillium dahliae]